MIYHFVLSILFTSAASSNDGSWALLTQPNGNVLSMAAAWSNFKEEFGVHKMKDPSPQGMIKSCSGSSKSNCASEKLQNFRLVYFKKAYNFITAHNAKYYAGKSKYRLKITQFADLSMSELSTYTGGEQLGRPQGEVLDDALDMDSLPKVSSGNSVDWRSSDLEIHNQGQCGSCWAFAATAMLENRIYQSTGKYTELANQELVDCVSGCYGCSGGWSFKATKYVEEYGIAADAKYEYTATDGSCANNFYSRKISAGGITAKYQSASGESDMAKIVKSGAMTIALDVLYDFYFVADEVYQPDYGSCSSWNNLYVGAHAISVVGFTDDYWIIQNSWGTGWGDSGYAYMVRGENVCNIGGWDNWSWVSLGSNLEITENQSTNDNSSNEGTEKTKDTKKDNSNKGTNKTLKGSSSKPDGGFGGFETLLMVAGGLLAVFVLTIGSWFGYKHYKHLGFETLHEPKPKISITVPRQDRSGSEVHL